MEFDFSDEALEAYTARAKAAALREKEIIAKHPALLTGEPSEIITLSEAGEKRTRLWLSDEMSHVDFALLTAKRSRPVLDNAILTGVEPITGKPLTPAQKSMAQKNAKIRHKMLRDTLRQLGYKTWITVMGKWREEEKTETETALFIPNVDLVPGHDKLPFERKFKPHVDTAKFNTQMAYMSDLFMQQAYVIRTNGVTILINPATKETQILRNILFGPDAMNDLLRTMKDPNAWNTGVFKPRAAATPVRFTEQAPAPELVDAVMFPRHLLHRGQGVFTMMMLSMSRLADQLIEWQD